MNTYNKIKTLLTIIALLFTVSNAQAFLNEDIYSNDKHIIWCINKYTLDYMAFENPTNNPTACFIWKGYETVVYKSSEYWGLIKQYDLTDTLDLLTIRALECKDSKGYCNGGWVDFWPFQLNSIHTQEVKITKDYIAQDKHLELFKYQAQWTYRVKLHGWAYYKWCEPYATDRKTLSKCRFKLHNGNNKIVNWTEYKNIYADAGWVIREKILKPYIKNNEYIGQQ